MTDKPYNKIYTVCESTDISHASVDRKITICEIDIPNTWNYISDGDFDTPITCASCVKLLLTTTYFKLKTKKNL